MHSESKQGDEENESPTEQCSDEIIFGMNVFLCNCFYAATSRLMP